MTHVDCWPFIYLCTAGRRVAVSTDGWQAWAKAMDGDRFQNAVLLINAAEQPLTVSLPLINVSKHFDCESPGRCPAVCGRDMYTGESIELNWNSSVITTTLPVRTPFSHAGCVEPVAKLKNVGTAALDLSLCLVSQVHDSAFYCVWPRHPESGCSLKLHGSGQDNCPV
jgi:hypothetical protein